LRQRFESRLTAQVVQYGIYFDADDVVISCASLHIYESRYFCRKECRAPRAMPACEPTPPLSVQLVQYSFFDSLLELLAEEFLQFIERAVPTPSVPVA
jgi:hypothetical protein